MSNILQILPMSDTPERAGYGLGQDEIVVSAFNQRTVEDSAAYLLPYIRPDSTVLDVGCGPGSITIGFAQLAREGRVTGLDTDAASATLANARIQAQAAGLSNIDFTTGDAHRLPFPDGTFDIVHTHQVLQHVVDPVAVLREMRRVAKPGGLVACRESDNDAVVVYPLYDGIKAYLKAFKAVVRMRGMEPVAGRRIHAWAREAGFDPALIRLSTSNWSYHTPPERRAWGKLCVQVVRNSEYSTVVVQQGFATADEVEEMAKAWEDWVTDEDGFFALMNVEMICGV